MRAGLEPFRTTAALQAPPSREGRTRHLAAGIAINVALVVLLSSVSDRIREFQEEPEPVTVVFYDPRPTPPPPPPLPAPVAAPRPTPPPRPIERPAPRETPPIARAEAPRPAPPPPAPAPPAPPRPAPAPEVRTGLFGEAERALPATGRSVRAPSEVGGFEVAATRSSSARSEARVVLGEGFGEETEAPRRRAPSGAGSVRATGFDEAADERPRAAKPRTAAADTAVEILSKPRPDYTEEARKLRVEGEVVVEVVFFATGRLDVLRVLRGLGHGLDEAAMEAVRKIQFTPATRDGVPVDQTAALRVVFRLA